MNKLLYTGKEWDFEKLEKTWAVIKDIAVNKFGLSFYDTEFEVITARQMIQNYTTHGLPVYYCSWEQGKHFNQQWNEYLNGKLGLAYEIVINTDPCICYLMDSNDMPMQTLVMSHAACVDKDTEYLSRTGWKKINEYRGEEVAQYHTDGNIEFVYPQRYIKRAEKEFYHITAPGIDQLITRDHRIIFKEFSGNLKEESADQFVARHYRKTRGHNGKFLTTFKYSGQGLPLSDDELRLAIAIKADGSFRPKVRSNHFNCVNYQRVRFHLKKTRKIERLKNLLNKLKIDYTLRSSYEGRVSIVFTVPDNNYYSKSHIDLWYSASEEQLQLISEEVLYWDGSIKSQKFSSIKKEEIDFIQFVWASQGYGTHIEKQKIRGNRKQCYDLTRSPRSLRSITASRKGRRDIPVINSTDGYSYCFTVPSGMFLARRNDCIFVTGNCGHNSLFKNNYLFKNNTEANFILEYMGFADKFIKKCERLYGTIEVMKVLDVAHMIQNHSYQPKRNKPPKVNIEEQRKEWTQYLESQRDELDKITFKHNDLSSDVRRMLNKIEGQQIKLPEYDLLYFIEKNIQLPSWQKEIMRIVRIVSSYFYPQVLCKLLHEAWASYVHYTLCTELWEQGYIDSESYLSIKHSHTQVANERPGYKPSLNPYYLGFNMFKDIERMCKNPTDEDRKYFPTIAGKGDQYFEICKEIAYNNTDESFVRQYMSPALLRQLKLVVLEDDSGSYYYKCVGSHEPEHYRQTVNHIANQYQIINNIPQMVITAVNTKYKEISLKYIPYKDRGLNQEDKEYILLRLEALTGWRWGKAGQAD